MKAKDGKLYAEITLRDVVEKNDVSDMPLLAEVKRLYDENAKLRNAVEYLYGFAKTLGVSGDDLREECGIEV